MATLPSAPLTTTTLLLLVLSCLGSFSLAFQSSLSLVPAPTQLQLQAANDDNKTKTQQKKKNPMGESILFGKPQYNWVTGKTEEKMTSSYIHNWNVSSKKRTQAQDGSVSLEKKGANEAAPEGKVEKKRAWWQM